MGIARSRFLSENLFAPLLLLPPWQPGITGAIDRADAWLFI
jgi:hypothetical protein